MPSAPGTQDSPAGIEAWGVSRVHASDLDPPAFLVRRHLGNSTLRPGRAGDATDRTINTCARSFSSPYHSPPFLPPFYRWETEARRGHASCQRWLRQAAVVGLGLEPRPAWLRNSPGEGSAPTWEAKSALIGHLPGELWGARDAAPVWVQKGLRALGPLGPFSQLVSEKTEHGKQPGCFCPAEAGGPGAFWPHDELLLGWTWPLPARKESFRPCTAAAVPPGLQSKGISECGRVCSQGPATWGFCFQQAVRAVSCALLT